MKQGIGEELYATKSNLILLYGNIFMNGTYPDNFFGSTGFSCISDYTVNDGPASSSLPWFKVPQGFKLKVIKLQYVQPLAASTTAPSPSNFYRFNFGQFNPDKENELNIRGVYQGDTAEDLFSNYWNGGAALWPEFGGGGAVLKGEIDSLEMLYRLSSVVSQNTNFEFDSGFYPACTLTHQFSGESLTNGSMNIYLLCELIKKDN